MICSGECRRRFLLMENPSPELALDFHNPWIRFWGAFHLQSHLWIYDDVGMSPQDCHHHLMIEALLHLDPTMKISEIGFDRTDAIIIGTPEAIDAWHHLMVGMNRLFIAAGLAPRTMAAVAGKVIEEAWPRRKSPR
ncbi:hypothetical protein Poly51_63740 [Rubripirellula tenax]|uniref:Uncharacterized protein n=2 Tax=Rubripirellula tenax TaxID=2528015 RepID=A0A5C6E1Z9_9BACT|nr:hypothetical protein Poly51_63740 [Rubripirellula tenax]